MWNDRKRVSEPDQGERCSHKQNDTAERKLKRYKTADNEIVNCEHDAIGNMAVVFVGTSGVQMGWLASQADMLAEDWVFAK